MANDECHLAAVKQSISPNVGAGTSARAWPEAQRALGAKRLADNAHDIEGGFQNGAGGKAKNLVTLGLQEGVTGFIFLPAAVVVGTIDLDSQPLATLTHQFKVGFDIANAGMDLWSPALHDHPAEKLNLGRTCIAQQLDITAVEGELAQDALLLKAVVEVCHNKQRLSGAGEGYVDEIGRTLHPAARTSLDSHVSFWT
jgi:hypothetical protein